ncbi:MAG: sulfatase-like hydrolase/transferase [Acidobacteriota bacterium]
MRSAQSFSRRALLAGAAIQAAPAFPQVERPNVLFIMTDQQSHHAWSGARNPYLRTPAMDSLAARGTVFAETYCTYPVCSPSRSSIFTSRMPHETGVEENGKAIKPGIPTMGEVFSAAGYKTAYAGKWHLPKSFDGMTGFEKLIGGSSQGKDMDEPVAHECSKWLRAKPTEPFLMVASFMNPHDICEWIRQHKGARAHPDTHPFPPAPCNMGIDPAEPESMQFHRTKGYDLMSQAVGIASDWLRNDVREYLHDYYRMIEDVDHHIGTVLTALRDSGLDRRTIVCFTSDHGEGMGAHRWVQKASFYEESSHVPLFLAGPGIAQGVSTRLTSLLDVMPTFCDVAGITPPAGIRGTSLRSTGPRDFVASELRYQDASRDGRMIRTGRYKYVVFRQGARAEQLFDLDTDPGEVVNLAANETARPVLDRHRAMLAEWMRSTGDNFQRT